MSVCKGGGLIKEQTSAINGICILIIILAHIECNGLASLGFKETHVLDRSFHYVLGIIGQMKVVPFLFFSGFGVMEQIKSRGELYLDNFLRCRVCSLYANFVVAVFFFLFLNLTLGNDVTVTSFLVALTGWSTIGNPSWYVFCILLFYLATWISVSTCRWLNIHYSRAPIGVLLFALVYFVVIGYYKQGSYWWFNIISAYVAGTFVSVYRAKVDRALIEHGWLITGVSLLGFVICHFVTIPILGVGDNIKALAFVGFVLGLTSRVRLTNPILSWIGGHIFPLYMYHMAFVMMSLRYVEGPVSAVTAYLITLFVILGTIVVAACYRFWEVRFR